MYVSILLSTLSLLYVYSFYKERTLKLYFVKDSLMQDIVVSCKFHKLTFRPFFLAFTRELQTLWYIVMEVLLQKLGFSSVRYEREVFKMKDGGQVALDWVVDKEGKGKLTGEEKGNFPILIIIAGLSGETDNVYTLDVIEKAKQRGYKTLIVGYRGCAGLELTSDKLYSLYSWEDLEEVLDFVHEKFCLK